MVTLAWVAVEIALLSPQLIVVALKSAVVASGLASVKVATVNVAEFPSVAVEVRAATLVSVASLTVTVLVTLAWVAVEIGLLLLRSIVVALKSAVVASGLASVKVATVNVAEFP